jgi:hypothetical protein
MNESSGLKAHRTLAPANARHARRQMMLGGKLSLKRFRPAKTREIAASAGQKILFSGRFCARPENTVWSAEKVIDINGATIKA